MVNKPAIDNEESAARVVDALPVTDRAVPGEAAATAGAPRTVRFAGGEGIKRAAEKVFRLHRRLFEELAK